MDESQAGPYISFNDSIFLELASQGQGCFAASGDSGGVVLAPSDEPYLTSVGITILSTDASGNYVSEVGSSISGGGPSTYESIPSYQIGIASGTSNASTTMRNTPDVAGNGDSSSADAGYVGGSWEGVYGSSFSTPVWASFIARVNQARTTPIGLINSTIYNIAKGSRYVTDFHDITTGSNGYQAVTGYDLVTGLGSFNGANLYNDLVSSQAPSGLTASPGNAQVVLSWNVVSSAVSYNIYRGTTNGGPYPTLVHNVTTNSYTNTGLTNGTTYYYVVTTVTTTGEESSYSSQAYATPIAPPSAPTGLLVQLGNTQATLSWSASATATSYNVKRSTVNGNGYSTVGTVTGLSFNDSGLVNNTTYYYVISALNAGGESPNSSQVVLTPSANLPLAPAGLVALADNQQIKLSWSASSAAISYNVKRSTISGGPYITLSSSGAVTTTSYIDSPITNGTNYYYVISAVNANGEGANSAEVNAAAGIKVPTNLNVKIIGAKIGTQVINGGVLLSWTQSTSANITQNKVYRSTNGGAYSLVAVISAGSSYVDKNMPRNVTYSYEVTALNLSGSESSFSSAVSVNF